MISHFINVNLFYRNAYVDVFLIALVLFLCIIKIFDPTLVITYVFYFSSFDVYNLRSCSMGKSGLDEQCQLFFKYFIAHLLFLLLIIKKICISGKVNVSVKVQEVSQIVLKNCTYIWIDFIKFELVLFLYHFSMAHLLELRNLLMLVIMLTKEILRLLHFFTGQQLIIEKKLWYFLSKKLPKLML